MSSHSGTPAVVHPQHPAADNLASNKQPSLEEDLSLLLWLQASQGLAAETTGYICDALLQWAMLGEAWPDPVEPRAGSGCDLLDILGQVTERLSWRIHDAQPLARKFDLARMARELSNAIRCQRDPEALRGSLEREMVHRMPWLAEAPTLVRLDDGRVL